MYSKQLESLIKAAMTDGVLTESEREILYKKADAEGIDRAEFDMILNARIFEAQQEAEVREKKAAAKRAKEERDELAEKNREEELAQARAKAEAEKAKLTKHGKTRKCPVCGALVPAVAAVCPECGYEFSDIETGKAIKEFSEKISKLSQYSNTGNSISEYIKSFPIPTTKADLYEFMTLILPKIDNDSYSYAYKTKYEECLLRVRTLFPNDPLFAKILEASAEKEQNIKLKKRKMMLLNIACCLVVGIVVLFVNDVDINIIKTTRNDSTKCNIAVQECIEKGDLDKATKYIHKFKGGHYQIVPSFEKTIAALMASGDIQKAMNLDDYCHTDERRVMRKPIYDYLLAQERFEEAGNYVPSNCSLEDRKYIDKEDYFKYMKDVVTILCKQGKREEAKQFVEDHFNWFNGWGWPEELDKKYYKPLQKIINNTK